MRINHSHLRAARERAGFSRVDLAKRAGISKDRVKQLELGQHPETKYETILALAQALGIPFSELSETEVIA